jgi:hypothetical protein
MVTNNSEADARAALRVFANARAFFQSGSVFPAVFDKPIRIYAFRSKDEYAPYRLNRNAFGHYLHSQRCDYIVLEDIKPEHYEAALHEYTHYVAKQAGLNLPTWLNEGLADLYSSMEPSGEKTVVGRPLPGRMMILTGTPLLDLQMLFAVTPDSSYYKEGKELPIFYAQSWALTHMLVLDKQYSHGFPGFLQAVSSGVPSSEAFSRIYGKTLAQVESDLKQYGSHIAGNRISFDLPFGSPSVEARVEVLSNDEKTLALADLLAAHPATAPQVLHVLAEVAKQDPGNPSVEERLGQAAWSMNRIEEARIYFGLAVKHGSRNTDAVYRYALMQKQAGAPDEEVIRLFERTLELSPDFDEARIHLGLLQFNTKRFAAAAQSLSKLKTVKDEWAYAYYSVVTYCDIEFNNIKEAEIFAQKARVNAKTPDEQSQTDELLLYLQTRKSSIQHGGVNTKIIVEEGRSSSPRQQWKPRARSRTEGCD